ncbi:MAG: DUF748 domain-containing protein [Deltaproteobacteria bacterium]|nr:DUF748 domain-containing protein [Deltaproteobacteria bacterium]
MVRRILRQKRVWALVVMVVLYTVFGFFIAPRIIKSQGLKAIAGNLGRQATLEKVLVNPYSLSLTLQGFELKDPDGTALVAFDDLYLNFQTSSLFRWAFTFKELRLDGPRIDLRRLPDGQPNFVDLIPDKSDEPPHPEGTQVKGIPRLIVGDLQINQGRLRITDLTRPEPEVVAFTLLNLQVSDFTTLPGHDGRYTLGATGQARGRWEWSGTVSLEPLNSTGSFVLTGTKLPEIWRVIKSRVNFEITDGELDFRTDYSFDMNGDEIVARLSDASLDLTHLTVREKGKEPNLLTLDTLSVTGMNMRYPEQTVGVGQVRLAGADILAWLTEAGDMNWLSVLEPPAPAEQTGVKAPHPEATGQTGTEPPHPAAAGQASVSQSQSEPSTEAAGGTAPEIEWTVSVDEFRIDDFSIGFEDRTTTPRFELNLAPLNVAVRNITSRPNSLFDLNADLTIAERGKFSIQGKVGVLPLVADATIRLSDLPLVNFQPYVSPIAKLELVRGTLEVSGDLHFREDEGSPDIRFKGSVASRNFLTKDALATDPFVSWTAIEVKDISLEPRSVNIGEVCATEPYADIIIHKDRSTNLADVFSPLGLGALTTCLRMLGSTNLADVFSLLRVGADTAAAAKAEERPKKSGVSIPTKIELVRVVHGSAHFADLSLIFPFATSIKDLNGEIRGFSSETLARADVRLDGSIQPTGVVQVRGEINPISDDLYTNLDVMFRDLDIPAFTPFSGTYIGRKIDKGKLSLDLKYRVSQRELLGENKIVLDQLELGNVVESPKATSLPVGLAIALLKNTKGQIDLDIPVEGNLDDPKFGIMDVILDALVTIVSKAATAPFALLGDLVGVDGDELRHISFEPGDCEIPPTGQEKLMKLSEALSKRSKLGIEVRGQVHPEEDAMAIREAMFSRLAAERIQSDPKKYRQSKGADGFSSRLLSDLYVEQFGKGSLKKLGGRFQVPVSETHEAEQRQKKDSSGETMLDERAFYAEIHRALVALQPVAEAELRTLALDRSTRIQALLVRKGQVADTRVFLLAVDDEGKFEDGRVRLDLKLTEKE